MTDISLSDTQAKALADIKAWFAGLEYDDEGRLLDTSRQVFRVFGYAGTGKTTLVKHAIAELGLSLDGLNPDVRFGAFTGKAAHVMRKHGTPARTIHSQAYAVMEATEAEISQAKEKLEKAKVEAINITDRFDRLALDARIVAMESEIKMLRRPRFVLNDQGPFAGCKLIALDEVSMVGQDMAADVLSFRKPVLVLGDPGQLPPIKGEGTFTQATPDVMLTEIHRQAGESAIIRLATMARNGEPIPYGQHDEFVWKMGKLDVNAQQLLRGGQVICGLNATRFDLNNAMRHAAGFDASNPLPGGLPGEKIICLKNDNKRGLINGMFIELEDVQPYHGPDPHRLRFRARARDDEGMPIRELEDDSDVSFDVKRERGEDEDGKLLTFYTGHFLDHVSFDKERGDRDWKAKKSLVECVWGWAITCHKAQGSQWENVIVWDDGLGRRPEDRRRWLYTALTRAERGLVILD